MAEQAAGGGISCGCGGIGTLLLIAGGVMYGVCKDAETTGSCGGNQEIADAGYIMMLVGAGLYAFTIAFCMCFCCLAACGAVMTAKN